MFGLKDEELKQIKQFLKKSNTSSSFIFGSRAKGTYKIGSDVDIAIDGVYIIVELSAKIEREIG